MIIFVPIHFHNPSHSKTDACFETVVSELHWTLWISEPRTPRVRRARGTRGARRTRRTQAARATRATRETRAAHVNARNAYVASVICTDFVEDAHLEVVDVVLAVVAVTLGRACAAFSVEGREVELVLIRFDCENFSRRFIKPLPSL